MLIVSLGFLIDGGVIAFAQAADSRRISKSEVFEVKHTAVDSLVKG
jgi:ssDNA-specific exonuclease RecJ